MPKPKVKLEHPLQPIYLDKYGTARFKGNAIVQFLLDAGPFDMNKIALIPGISREDREQFAQLIGYSVSGFGDLSYARSRTVREADLMAEHLMKRRSK